VTVAEYTVDEIRTIIRTLESGLVQVRKGVQFVDRGVTYNSAEEIFSRIRYFQSLLRGFTDGRPKQSLGVACKGF